MPDIYDLRQERDNDLLLSFVDRAYGLKSAYHEWIQVELRDCIYRAQVIERTLPRGPVRSNLHARIQRMKEIDTVELKEAINNIKDTCQELRHVVSDDIIGDCQRLEDCLSRFHGLVRELLGFRPSLDGLWEPDSQAEK